MSTLKPTAQEALDAFNWLTSLCLIGFDDSGCNRGLSIDVYQKQVDTLRDFLEQSSRPSPSEPIEEIVIAFFKSRHPKFRLAYPVLEYLWDNDDGAPTQKLYGVETKSGWDWETEFRAAIAKAIDRDGTTNGISKEQDAEISEAIVRAFDARPSPSIEAMLDALLTALPFVEDAENNPSFKKGWVKEQAKHIRAVIAQAIEGK